MNFHGTGSIHLPGTPLGHLRVRPCDACGRTVNAHGGVQLRPGKWHCAACWRRPLTNAAVVASNKQRAKKGTR